MKKRYLMEYNMVFANIFSFILMIAFGAIAGLIIGSGLIDINIVIDNKHASIIIFEVIGMFLYLAIHELVHGISYILCGADRSNIKYGIALDKGILFCKCGQEVDKRNILISIMAPFVILGIVTGVISIVFNIPYLFFLSFINICGCSGDLMMFAWFFKRESDFTFREVGDSTTFVINTNEDLDKKKFLTCKVKEVLEKDIIDDKYLNKINSNKVSNIILIFIIVIMIINLILLNLG